MWFLRYLFSLTVSTSGHAHTLGQEPPGTRKAGTKPGTRTLLNNHWDKMTKLSLEQIKQIPTLAGTRTLGQIATQYNVHERTINYWVKRLRGQGITITVPKGRKPLSLS